MRLWEAEHSLSLESHVICQTPTASHGLPWPHRSASHFGLPRTPMASQFGLTDRTPMASHGLPHQPHRSASQIGLTDLDSLIGSDRSHEKMWEAECLGGRILEAVGGRGRPWEAVGGRGRPRSPDWLRQISKPMRGARPPTASQIRPPTHRNQ